MNILLVDSDEYYHINLNNLLSDMGTVTSARSCEEGLQAWRQTKPDAVVMELFLEDKAGYELLEKITAEEIIPKILIYSRMSTVPDVEACLNFGAQAYLVKGRNRMSEIRNILLTEGK